MPKRAVIRLMSAASMWTLGVHIAAEVRAVGPFPFVASSLSIIGVIDHAIAVDVAEELAQADRSRAYGTALDASDVVCGNHGGRSVTSRWT